MVSAKAFIGCILASSIALVSASDGKLTIVDCVYSKRAFKFVPYHSYETHFIYEAGGKTHTHKGENSHAFFNINRQREKNVDGLKIDLESDKTVKLSKDGKNFRTGKPNEVINNLEKLRKLCKPNSSNDVGDLVSGFNSRSVRIDSKAQVYTGLPNFFS